MKLLRKVLILILFTVLITTLVYVLFEGWIESRVRHIVDGKSILRYTNTTFGHDGNIHVLGFNDGLWMVTLNQERFIRQRRLTGLPEHFRVADFHVLENSDVLITLYEFNAYDDKAIPGLYYSADGRSFNHVFSGAFDTVMSSMSQYDETVRFFVADGKNITNYKFDPIQQAMLPVAVFPFEEKIRAGIVLQNNDVYAAAASGLFLFNSEVSGLHTPPDRLLTKLMQYEDRFNFIDGTNGYLTAYYSDRYSTILTTNRFPGISSRISSLFSTEKGMLALFNYNNRENLHYVTPGGETISLTDFIYRPLWRCVLELSAVSAGILILAVFLTLFIINVRKMYFPVVLKGALIMGLLSFWAVNVLFIFFINPLYIENRRDYASNMLLRYVHDAHRQGLENRTLPLPGFTDINVYFIKEENEDLRITDSTDSVLRAGFLADAPGALGMLLDNKGRAENVTVDYAADTVIYTAYSVSNDGLIIIGVADGRFIEADAAKFLYRIWLLFLSLAFFIMIICVIYLSSIVGRIRLILRAIDNYVHKGSDLELNPGTKDELWALAVSFNKMGRILRSRFDGDSKRSMTYLQFIPRRLVSLMGVNEIDEVDKGTTSSQDLTMMVVSFSFPEHVYQKSAKDLFDDINDVTQKISAAVTRNNGTIYNFTYDSCDAVFPEGPVSAVSAAVEMRQGIMTLNKEREEKNEGSVVLRAAIDKGIVLMGVVGDDSRIVPTAMSSHLNTARMLQRICQTLDSGILCTTDVANQADDYFIRYVGKVHNGKQLMRVYEVVDGDEFRVKSGKEKTRKQFNEGLLTLYSHDYTTAKRIFMDIARIDSGDGAVRHYLYLADRLENGSETDVCISQRRL